MVGQLEITRPWVRCYGLWTYRKLPEKSDGPHSLSPSTHSVLRPANVSESVFALISCSETDLHTCDTQKTITLLLIRNSYQLIPLLSSSKEHPNHWEGHSDKDWGLAWDDHKSMDKSNACAVGGACCLTSFALRACPNSWGREGTCPIIPATLKSKWSLTLQTCVYLQTICTTIRE